jgi:tetracycline 7-halogenase / FADH2 O2-dependent halogenase
MTATDTGPRQPPALRTIPDHDVIILGTGFAGTVLGAILARHGARVLLVDAGAHPKFAVGESMIPYTLLTLRIISERYDVPEIVTLSSFKGCSDKINPSFGQKKHFGFIRHQPGEEPDPREASQLNTPGVLNTSSHLFRQDADAYLFHVAVRYGCRVKLAYRVAEVDFDDAGVVVKGADGAELRGRYLVDASGFRSPLAQKLDLREAPCRFQHHSRSIFTHMVGVEHFDDVLRHRKDERPPVPWNHGTMHHVFDRGWFWVIPFNNNKLSQNPLCSVGVTMDPRLYPKPQDVTPEQEFFQFVGRFPAVARQFAKARAVREWVSTDRLQYSSKSSIGERWCLMSHAAGFLDPLFSRGLYNTSEVINAFAWRLLAALREDDFSRERFEYVERLEQGLLDYNDKLVNCSFISFDTYDLWNAVFRIWGFGSAAGSFRIQRGLSNFKRSGDDRHLRALEDPPHVGLWWPDHAGYKELFDAMVSQVEAFEQGAVTAKAAADELFGRLQQAEYIPHPIGFSDRDRPFIRPSARHIAATMKWLAVDAPSDVRGMFLGTIRDAARATAKGRKLW